MLDTSAQSVALRRVAQRRCDGRPDANWSHNAVRIALTRRQPVIDEKFGAFIGKIVSRLEDKNLKHHHGRRVAARLPSGPCS